MAIEFHEGIEAPCSLVDKCGIQGNWLEEQHGKYTFRSQQGGILNYWPKKGSVQLQGKPEGITELEAVFGFELTSDHVIDQVDSKVTIFVVHGHDKLALEQLELVLRRLELDPYILQNDNGDSRTLIEALEQKIYEEAAFGIVLLTPDDYGYPHDKSDDDRQPSARQNVILELGMVLASLGRERTALLKKGALELPTDVSGIIYLEFNEHVKEVGTKLARRMQNAGININADLIPRVTV